jgi:tripartite ATP-independent transporter DctP family solute receptor
MGQLGDERDMTEGIRMGTIDMIVTANGMVTNFVPEAVVFDLPYLFEDQDHALRAMLSPTGQRVVKIIEPKIGKILGYYGAGTRSIFNRVRPINTPEDLKGLKIRVLQNKIYISTLNSLGGLATPLPFSEVYGALQQGVIDGAENDPPSLLGMKHYEQVKYFSMTKHFVQSGYLFMNWDRWNRLAPEHQKVLAEVSQLSQKEERDYERAKYDEALTELRRLGIQINEVKRASFVERARNVWREIPSQYLSIAEELQKVK